MYNLIKISLVYLYNNKLRRGYGKPGIEEEFSQRFFSLLILSFFLFINIETISLFVAHKKLLGSKGYIIVPIIYILLGFVYKKDDIASVELSEDVQRKAKIGLIMYMITSLIAIGLSGWVSGLLK
jgi:EamA domain-containing membrane protein RarD